MTAFTLKGLLTRKLRTALTAIAIVLGVAMISGTYILTDTMQKSFNGLFTDASAQTDAVIAHDASAALGEIDTPTLITFGARDLVCSTRFAEPLKSGIAGSELVVFEHLSHAGLHEDPDTFNRATLEFLLRQRS